jgi:DNA-binding XRE family transcriptional regulator
MDAKDVKRIRDRLGLTRKAFAALIGATPTTVYRWETNASSPNDVLERKLLKLQHEPRTKWAKRVIDKHDSVEKRQKVYSKKEKGEWARYIMHLEKLFEMIEEVVGSLPFLEVSRGVVEVPFGYFESGGPKRTDSLTCLTVTDRGERAVHFLPRGINYLGEGGKVAIRQIHPRRAMKFNKGGVFIVEGGKWIYFEHTSDDSGIVDFEEADIRRLVERTFIGQT